MDRSSVALSNLRAIVILIVIAFHSVLPYLASLPATAYTFDDPPFRWQAFPIVDSQRWFGFDLFCAWQDLSLMALMFLLSGLFVIPSLTRKGSAAFLTSRLLRIGLPCVVAVVVLAPLAYYPSYRVTAVDPGLGAYWQHLQALPFWPCGPQWFLCVLLAFNLLVIAILRIAPQSGVQLARLVAIAAATPLRFFVVLTAVSALAYAPLALIYSPFEWTSLGPVSFQLSRPVLYLVYFVVGAALGANGLGLLACDGALARQWAAWLGMAVLGFILWAIPTSATLQDWNGAPLAIRLATSLGFAVACTAGCLFLLAVCLRFLQERRPALMSLAANSYSMYLLHYTFAVWLQYALLDTALFAIGKAAIVFCGTLIASWSVSAALGGLPLLSGAKTGKQRLRDA